MRGRLLVGAVLLFGLLPCSGIAAADSEDGPLPPGMKGRILNISGDITDVGGGTKNSGGATQNAGGGPASVSTSVQELAAPGSGITVKETGQSLVIGMQAELLFDFDRADLRPTAVATLQKIAQFITARATPSALIEGHTDAKGSIPYNQKLSLARAESVRRWFVERGALTSVDFTTSGYGASKPVAPNVTADGRDDPAGRQKNRRVEITIAKK